MARQLAGVCPTGHAAESGFWCDDNRQVGLQPKGSFLSVFEAGHAVSPEGLSREAYAKRPRLSIDDRARDVRFPDLLYHYPNTTD